MNYNGDVCIRLAYHMRGRGIGSLQVRKSEEGEPVWEKGEESGDDWQTVSIETRLEREDQVGSAL